MKTITQRDLVRRARQHRLDRPIRVGDTVHLRLADGTASRSVVIYDAPFLGEITYTADDIERGLRARFSETAVHAVESLWPIRHGAC